MVEKYTRTSTKERFLKKKIRTPKSDDPQNTECIYWISRFVRYFSKFQLQCISNFTTPSLHSITATFLIFASQQSDANHFVVGEPSAASSCTAGGQWSA